MMTNEVKWSAFGMPIEEPSEEEINHWRSLSRLWVNYDHEIERLEQLLKELKETRDSIVHVLECGPKNNILEQMDEQRDAAQDGG